LRENGSLMNRLSSPIFSPRPRIACVLAAGTALVLGFAATAQAGVVFPTPGNMTVTGVPLTVRPGHTFTLHEDLPLAVFNGEFALQSESSTGVWQTLIAAPPRPRIVWLHWKVPMALKGSQLTVRYVLLGGTQMLAVSPNYTLGVSS
jgi:hypothetical protein